MVQSRQLASILVGADRATCALWVSTTWREAVALSYRAGILSRCYNFADVGQRRISMHGTQDGRMHRSRTGCAPRPFAQRSVTGWDWPLFVFFALISITKYSE